MGDDDHRRPPSVGLPTLLVLRDGATRLTHRGHVGFEDRSALHAPRSSPAAGKTIPCSGGGFAGSSAFFPSREGIG